MQWSELLERLLQKYRSAETFSCYGLDDAGYSIDTPFAIKYKRPAFCIKFLAHGECWENGIEGGRYIPNPPFGDWFTWFDGDSAYARAFQRPTEELESEAIALLATARPVSCATRTQPLLLANVRYFESRSCIATMQDGQVERIDTLAGRECFVVSGTFMQALDTEIWIDATTFSLARIRKKEFFKTMYDLGINDEQVPPNTQLPFSSDCVFSDWEFEVPLAESDLRPPQQMS